MGEGGVLVCISVGVKRLIRIKVATAIILSGWMMVDVDLNRARVLSCINDSGRGSDLNANTQDCG